MNAAFLSEGLSDSVHSWEVQLVLEYCDKGSLRALLNKQGTLVTTGGCGNGKGGVSDARVCVILCWWACWRLAAACQGFPWVLTC